MHGQTGRQKTQRRQEEADIAACVQGVAAARCMLFEQRLNCVLGEGAVRLWWVLSPGVRREGTIRCSHLM